MSNPNGGRNFRNPRWTPEDDMRVLATQSIQDRQALAKALGRSYNALTQRRLMLCNAQKKRTTKEPKPSYVRYPKEVRDEVVRRYKAGAVSYGEVDRQFGLPRGSTRNWVLEEAATATRTAAAQGTDTPSPNPTTPATPNSSPTAPLPNSSPKPWKTVVTGRGLHLTGVAHFVLTGGPQGLTAKVTFT